LLTVYPLVTVTPSPAKPGAGIVLEAANANADVAKIKTIKAMMKNLDGRNMMY
jgi:hypothetical protein